ncbi:hypothetical protein [Budvicia aquatica]|uniref:hypothetical protein n=1 Tax=Budvicia aquatica TaxID=82979 RepID=UPI002100F525|nr:hypothetical protein [Budvicia aquatica]
MVIGRRFIQQANAARCVARVLAVMGMVSVGFLLFASLTSNPVLNEFCHFSR